MIDPIVSADWLQHNASVTTICEVRPGGEASTASFLSGHLAGAILVDLDAVLAGPPAPVVGRHPLPEASAFAAAMGALGIGNEATVVAYDDLGGAYASRLVWMLRIIGQDAALLDGGRGAWTGAVEQGEATIDPVERSTIQWPDHAIADSETVADHIVQGGTVIDSRSPERYRGEVEPLDAIAGHVPGARNLPFAANLDADGRFLDPTDLAQRFADIEDPDPIVYCGSGVTACHNALAMEATGRPRPRVYVGSWSGWSTEPGRVIRVGDES